MLSHRVDARTDVVPDLRPHLGRRLAERPGVLLAQRVEAVGVVAEERQLGSPGHPHGEPGGEHEANDGLQALRPAVERAEGGRVPVDREEVMPDLVRCARTSAALATSSVARRPAVSGAVGEILDVAGRSSEGSTETRRVVAGPGRCRASTSSSTVSRVVEPVAVQLAQLAHAVAHRLRVHVQVGGHRIATALVQQPGAQRLRQPLRRSPAGGRRAARAPRSRRSASASGSAPHDELGEVRLAVDGLVVGARSGQRRGAHRPQVRRPGLRPRPGRTDHRRPTLRARAAGAGGRGPPCRGPGAARAAARRPGRRPRGPGRSSPTCRVPSPSDAHAPRT